MTDFTSFPIANTAFTGFGFAATGAPTSRTMPARLAEVVNVKDWGAVGNGSTDDTAAIQAALNHAYGSSGSPHKDTSVFSNKAVFFPQGNYRITSSLTLTAVMGAHIFGSGRFTTRIFNDAAGNVFTTAGCEYSRFELMRLSTSGSGVCFDLDWAGAPDPNGIPNQSNTFADMFFDGGAEGVRIGHTGGGQGSENLFLDCFFESCSVAGLSVRNSNALQNTVVGGNFQASAIGIYVAFGSVNVVSGVGFQQSSDYDIKIDEASQTMCVTGCRSESPNFISMSQGIKLGVYGCQQTSGGSRGMFLFAAGGYTDLAGCLFDGQIEARGPARLCIRASQPFQVTVGDWLILNPALMATTNTGIDTHPCVVEIENITPYTAGVVNAYDAHIFKQRKYTADNITLLTKNYTVS